MLDFGFVSSQLGTNEQREGSVVPEPMPELSYIHAIELACRQWWVAPNMAIIRGYLDGMMVVMYDACLGAYRDEHGSLDALLPDDRSYRPVQSCEWFDVNMRPDLVLSGLQEVQRSLELLPTYREAKEGDAFAEIKRVFEQLETFSSVGGRSRNKD